MSDHALDETMWKLIVRLLFLLKIFSIKRQMDAILDGIIFQ